MDDSKTIFFTSVPEGKPQIYRVNIEKPDSIIKIDWSNNKYINEIYKQHNYLVIKYSTDKHIRIVMINKELCFESRGECIKHPLSYYIEPFTKDNPSKNSFGLGLYLVDSILKAHNQVLAHEYVSGVNRFIFA